MNRTEVICRTLYIFLQAHVSVNFTAFEENIDQHATTDQKDTRILQSYLQIELRIHVCNLNQMDI